MLDYLLPELVSHVLNYTSQDDCLEFLRVCRRWHREVPVHAQHLWRQLNLTPSWGKTANDCLKMCLGPHVQRVSITGLEFDSYWILKKLAYLTCNITSLEISEFREYENNDATDPLISCISPFKDTLTELVIYECSSDISLVCLLRSLPKLTHLTFQFIDWYERRNSSSIFAKYRPEYDTESGNGFTSNLVYLHMEVPSYLYDSSETSPSDFQQEFDTIISSCPNLRALVVPNHYYSRMEPLIDCDLLEISSRCPRLRYLLWDMDTREMKQDHQQTLNRWKTVSASSDDDTHVGALREVIYQDKLHRNKTIVALLKRSQQRLVHVQFNLKPTHALTQLKELAELRLPNLKQLVLKNVGESQSEWIGFVMACRQLESLYLGIEEESNLLYNIVEAIHTPASLKVLKLYAARGCSSTGNTTISPLLHKFTALQTFHLSNVCMSDQILLDICQLETLRTLVLDMTFHKDYISLSGLLQAADNLRVMESGIQDLQLIGIGVDSLTDTVLECLGEVKYLSKIFISINFQITEQGVLAFIHGPSNGSNRSCHVSKCANVAKYSDKMFLNTK